MIMGADTNKKKVAALILSRVKPNGKTEDMGESGDGKSPDSQLPEGQRAAAEELIAAFHAKDAEALVSAFKSLIELVDDDGDESEEGEGGEKSDKGPSIFG